MTSIYDAIKKDHDRHRQLLATIADISGESEARKKAWEDFYSDVKTHAAAEEETFYSKLMQETWGQDMARHSVHEHKELDDHLEELRDTDMSSPDWMETFKSMRHDYEHHIDEEEEDLFARAREVIGAEHNDRFGQEFLDRKKKEHDLIEKKREEALEE